MTNDNNNINDLESEYLTPDLETDNDMTAKIKIIISNLPSPHKRIFVMYVHYANIRAVAKYFNVSSTLIFNYIKVVKNIIKADIDKDIEEIIKKYKVK